MVAKKVVISGADAIAEAVKMCKPKVLPMYPITPSTLIPEKLSEFVFNGEIDAKMIHVESEHSAASALFGAYAAGVRSFTATASNGLAYMHEMIPIISAARFPAVMAVANRTISGPINIWNDHSDSMSERDQGWIQLYVESSQEAFDTILMAYKLAEKENVSLPVMVCLDGFYLSHVFEPVQLEEQQSVDKFLPDYKPKDYLDVNSPKTFGPIAFPNSFMEFHEQEENAMQEALKEILTINLEFKKQFNRVYGDGLIEEIELADAEYAIVTVGSVTGTARVAVEELRQQGKKVGVIKIKSIRPFPKEELIKATKNLKSIGVIDKHVSLGSDGAVTLDVKSALYGTSVKVEGFIAGLGGRDITVEKIKKVFECLEKGNKGYWLK
ncbi:MAG: transketolase C-terminal domain-containing protein [Candidatus ainarchaeum sp.]|nr:transketolase C-terminal domain-containing protein [Candidatus ainarchaeum sp.]